MKLVMKNSLIILFTLCAFNLVQADDGIVDVSDALVEKVSDSVMPSVAVSVVLQDKIFAHGATGKRKVGSDEKVTIQDKFHLGSCTKNMTAMLGAILAKEKILSWDTKIVDVFPEIPIHESYQTANLKHLLSNSAGCPTRVPRKLWSELWKMEPDPIKQRMHLLKGMLAEPASFSPGSDYLYSNSGFAIAGAMMEKLTDQPYEKLMKEKLFSPLGMHSAGFGPPATKGKIDHPYGHHEKLFKLKPVDPYPGGDNPVAIAPAGRVHCSIDDFARYALFLLNGSEQIDLSLEEIQFVLKPASKNGKYALGMGITQRKWGKGTVYTHTGSNTMFYSVIWVAPKADFAIVAACNSGLSKAYKVLDSAVWDNIQEFLLDE